MIHNATPEKKISAYVCCMCVHIVYVTLDHDRLFKSGIPPPVDVQLPLELLTEDFQLPLELMTD